MMLGQTYQEMNMLSVADITLKTEQLANISLDLLSQQAAHCKGFQKYTSF